MKLKVGTLVAMLGMLMTVNGCTCDANADCRKNAALALTLAQSASAAPLTTAASAAGQAAQMVLRDPGASQERKSQALQLLFELERNERLESTIARVDELAAELRVLLERKVEADGH